MGAGGASQADAVFIEQAALGIAREGTARDGEDEAGLEGAAVLTPGAGNDGSPLADNLIETFLAPIGAGMFAGFVHDDAVHLVPGEQGAG